MKYTKEQRLDIGRRIYDGELTRYEAAEEYGISEQTARDYMRHYRDANQLPPKRGVRSCLGLAKTKSIPVPTGLEDLQSMTKEELIDVLVMARITEARLKKRLSGGRSWCGKDVHSYRQEEYEVVMELSGQFPIRLLCTKTGIPRSSFYNWKKSVEYPPEPIKALFTHPRATTSSCPCTTLSGQCPEPAHRQTMPRWRRLMVGSRPNSLQISILLRRRMSPLRYPTTSASSTRSALHMPLDTLRRSSIGSGSRQSTKARLLDTCPLNGGHGCSVYHIFDEYVQYLNSND